MTEPLDRDEMATDPAVARKRTSQNQPGSPEIEGTEKAEAECAGQESEDLQRRASKRRISWSRALAYGALPGLTLLLAMAMGYMKWDQSFARSSEIAAAESLGVAKDSTVALLAYQYNTVEKTVGDAQHRLTAPFKAAYAQLTRNVVIPGAREKHVSVTVTVPEAASVSATPTHAVALLFVNQSAVAGTDPPIETVSSIRVTLQKIDGRWLISGFDPI
jgi:Mce-associated membrane protein